MLHVWQKPNNHEENDMSVFKKFVQGALTKEEADSLLEAALVKGELVLTPGEEFTCLSAWAAGKNFASGVKKQLFDELHMEVYGKKP